MLRNRVSEIIICGIVIVNCIVIHSFSDVLKLALAGSTTNSSALNLTQLADGYSKEYGWAIKLAFNCFGYSCVLLPGYLLYRYVQCTHYLEKSESSYLHSLVRMCIAGNSRSEVDSPVASAPKNSLKRSGTQDVLRLAFCFAGLMGSYLTWGVLQEEIMTQEYVSSSGQRSYFKDSQFLVFANRLLAFCISGVYLLMKGGERYRMPLYKYSLASFSNIMSAWFQYEALKFVNFPTQVLAKSCKIIPVMVMGRLISRNKYETYEYVTAGLICFGMVFFMTGRGDSSRVSSATTLTGLFLLAMYLVLDSFTGNWQSALFKSYAMSSVQMMWGINLFSTIFTASSLSVQGGFMDSMEFATQHPKFIFDCVWLSISSAVGQLFIFYTISEYGAIVFTYIMTLRQAMAIIISCVKYHHSISWLGIFGIVLVFIALFLRGYCTQRLKNIRSRLEASRTKLVV